MAQKTTTAFPLLLASTLLLPPLSRPPLRQPGTSPSPCAPSSGSSSALSSWFWPSSRRCCPAIISLAGIGVGCCPPLKNLLFGAHAPLEFVAHSLHTISGATVPVMSFILGAVLYRGPGKAKVPKRVLWGVIVVRFVAVPVLGGLAVIFAERAHWFRPVDPLFMFTLVSFFLLFIYLEILFRQSRKERGRESRGKKLKNNTL